MDDIYGNGYVTNIGWQLEQRGGMTGSEFVLYFVSLHFTETKTLHINILTSRHLAISAHFYGLLDLLS